MTKKVFLHGAVAAVLATVACLIYLRIYHETLGADFAKIVNFRTIAAGNIFGCLLIAFSYWILIKINKLNLKKWLNIIIAMASFASIIIPISISLPLYIQSPELFPGLVIPMHFFPALAFFAIAPFFDPNRN
jgi:hypothetical protein